MEGWRVLSIVVACVVLFVVLEMMRRRKLREKYAGVWLIVAIGVVVLAVIPAAAKFLAGLTGVETPSNFVFLLAGVVLALVSLHLSTQGVPDAAIAADPNTPRGPDRARRRARGFAVRVCGIQA
ncbi:hypothetical protein AMES_8768 [Amycolatopsis mediterranei S699]|uniref:DUF2304 domain-containing protein n=2 Tax=Amycolatopsis mediterranei TaxID=33910 RepID=A0A0H3DLK1_AMYMU|nr:DUF2304 domain-containing protein [Amycolatopsis mediterranei]ADJ50594.1 conserved hypothetical protein [Amycolatopsis mediterranei U32]AEK47600.1 hypothetical protein RAM_45675 [Amycolatopsis mediterranei S699]AFO82300.1 hypothetical protein AMES_8768 [Amycolatopsis mediterranei S699]AGT89429.1 hypothetical protein B737_8769 [Amycolatopsis mediterranei RB]KDU87600.1 hypothetical protein DV36_34560 [Amycolatopsis mediterranei]